MRCSQAWTHAGFGVVLRLREFVRGIPVAAQAVPDGAQHRRRTGRLTLKTEDERVDGVGHRVILRKLRASGSERAGPAAPGGDKVTGTPESRHRDRQELAEMGATERQLESASISTSALLGRTDQISCRASTLQMLCMDRPAERETDRAT